MADTTPPQLTSLTLPTVIDITGGDQRVTFGASLLETESGVRQVTIFLDRSFQDEIGTFPLVIIFPDFPDDFSDGSGFDGRLASRFNGPGTFSVTRIEVSDRSGNQRTYLPDELNSLGFRTSFEVFDAGYKPSDSDDFLLGSGRGDALEGRGGNDIIFGLNGDDALNGGSGNDRLFGGEGNDALDGQQGDDVLFGEGGLDRLAGGDGNDEISGQTGDDRLFGGTGEDRLKRG